MSTSKDKLRATLSKALATEHFDNVGSGPPRGVDEAGVARSRSRLMTDPALVNREEVVRQVFGVGSSYKSPWVDGGASLFAARESGIQESFMKGRSVATERDLLILLMDDEIAQAFDTRRSAAISTPWRLEAPDGTKSLREEDKFVKTELNRVIQPLLRGIWSAVPLGRSFVNLVYRETEEGRVGWSRTIELPFHKFAVNAQWEIVEAAKKGDQNAQPVDEQRILTTIRNQSSLMPNGEMMLMKLYVPWSYRCHAWDFWMQALDRFGTPFLVGKVADPNAIVNKQTKETMLSRVTTLLDRARRGAAIVMGKDDAVDSIKMDNIGNQFEQLEQAVVKRVRLLVLGQTLTSDVGNSGSRALGEVHNTVRMDKRDDDVKLLQDSVQKAVNILWALNEFQGEPPIFVMADEKMLELPRAERDAKLSPVLAASGLQFSTDYFQEQYGIAEEYLRKATARSSEFGTQFGSNHAFSIEELSAGTRNNVTLKLADALEQSLVELGGSPIAPSLLLERIKATKDPAELDGLLDQLSHTPETLKRFGVLAAYGRLCADLLGRTESRG